MICYMCPPDTSAYVPRIWVIALPNEAIGICDKHLNNLREWIENKRTEELERWV